MLVLIKLLYFPLFIIICSCSFYYDWNKRWKFYERTWQVFRTLLFFFCCCATIRIGSGKTFFYLLIKFYSSAALVQRRPDGCIIFRLFSVSLQLLDVGLFLCCSILTIFIPAVVFVLTRQATERKSFLFFSKLSLHYHATFRRPKSAEVYHRCRQICTWMTSSSAGSHSL